MRIVSWDVETFLIAPGRLAPPLVCATFAEANQPGIILGRVEALTYIAELLADPDVLLLAHNGSYDTAVMMAEDETLIPAFFAAYDAGRILDTKIREELMDIAVGRKQDSGKMLVLRERGWEPVKYHLADLTMRYLGIDRTSEKNDPQGWRLRYAELAGVPMSQWPAQAIEYAIADAETTLAVYYEQQKRAEALRYTDDLHVTDERQQVKAALALHLASCWGMRTDGQRVAALKLKYEAMKDKLFGRLKKVGFYRIGGTKKEPKWQKDTKRVKAYVERVYEKHPDGQPPQTEKGAVSTDRLTLEDSGSRLLKSLADLGAIDKILTTYLPVLEAGTVTPINTRFNVLVGTSRTSSQNPNLQNIPSGRVLGGVRECFVPRPESVYCSVDYSQLELCTLAQVLKDMFGTSAMGDAINAGNDLHTQVAATLLGMNYKDAVEAKKAKDKTFDQMRLVAKCFHPDTELLTKTGFKKITEVTMNDEIACPVFNKLHVDIEWHKPQALTNRQHGNLLRLHNEAIDLTVTKDHRMTEYSTKLEPVHTTALAFGNARFFPSAGVSHSGSSFDHDLLRLVVAVQADGSFHGGGVRFGFAKPHKIERLISLCKGASITFDTAVSRNDYGPVYQLNLRRCTKLDKVLDLLTEDKQFSWKVLELDLPARRVFMDELKFWDGSIAKGQKHGSYSVCTVDEQTKDVVMAVAATTGYKVSCVKGNQSKQNDKWQDSYSIHIKGRIFTRGENVDKTEVPYQGTVYCVTTPTDAVMGRSGGKIFLTNQCANFGMAGGMSVQTFKRHAYRSLRRKLSDKDARAAHKAFRTTWPEMPAYFTYVSERAGMGTFTFTAERTGFKRGECGYTDGCNVAFQHLAAALVKEAMWRVCREMYADPTSPLHGSRLNAAIHDELFAELPKSRATPAAKRMTELMLSVAETYTPDVKLSAEPALMRYWTKEAGTKYNEVGELIVHE